MLFNRAISLRDSDKGKLLVFHKLSGGCLKVNSHIVVPDGYEMIVTHYDKVCDRLPAGSYKFDRVDMPLLTKLNKPKKTRKGEVVPKKFQADMYFIYTDVYSSIKYKADARCMVDGKKKYVKIKGECDIKVNNTLKFLISLLEDYATINNKETTKELSLYMSKSVDRVLKSNILPIEDYVDYKEKIEKLLDDYINKVVGQIGVEARNNKITDVNIPNKIKSKLEQNAQDSKDNRELQDFINNKIKQDDDPQDAQDRVTDEQPVDNTGSSTYDQSDRIEINVRELIREVENNTTSNQPVSNNTEQRSDVYNKYLDEIKRRENSTQSRSQDTTPLEAPPSLFEDKSETVVPTPPVVEPKPVHQDSGLVCSNCGTPLPAGAKFCYNCGKTTSRFKTCPCCGAKNFAHDTKCCVCKSDLD